MSRPLPAAQRPALRARLRPALRPLVRLLLWGGLLALGWAILRAAPLGEAWRLLGALTAGQILALAAVNLLILLLFPLRWWLILRAQGWRAPFLALFTYRLAGFGLSYLTPGPQFGGEPLQVWLLHKKHGLPAPAALAAVSLDRLFELLANLAFLALGVFTILNIGLGASIATPWRLLGAAALPCLPLAYLLALGQGRFPLAALLRRLPSQFGKILRLPRWSPAAVATERQMAALVHRRTGAMLGLAAISALTWALVIGEYWLSLAFLGLPLGLGETIAALTAARAAFILPLPGGLGALEAGQALAMQALGAGAAYGLSLSLLIRARDLLLAAVGLILTAWLARSHRPAAAQYSASSRQPQREASMQSAPHPAPAPHTAQTAPAARRISPPAQPGFLAHFSEEEPT